MKTVLVIENEPTIRLVIREALRDAGFEPVLAESGETALERLQAGLVPAVMIVDLVMPGVSGREVLGRVRGNPAWADIPAIITTGAEPSPETHPDRDQYQAYFVKPFRLGDLVETVRRLSD